MLLIILITVAILLGGYLMMSLNQVTHINRAAIAMITGVVVWVVLLTFGRGIVHGASIAKYVLQAVQVILFLIASSTIVEIMNNNGVFDALYSWMRTRGSRLFMWDITLLTFCVSANVDNLTTCVLMLTIMNKIVQSSQQKMVYACAIYVAAMLGGSFTVIGDMTSLMMWINGVITPTTFASGLILPALASLIVFNLLMQKFLVGRVEAYSEYAISDSGSHIKSWQKILLLLIGIVGLWLIPTFTRYTHLPPFLGALCVLSLVWMIDGIYNFKSNGRMLFVQKKSNTEFLGMRLILYFLGITIGVGALVECGALNFVGNWLVEHVHNVYLYGLGMGVLSSVIDNIPFVMMGLNIFPTNMGIEEIAVDGSYWQLLSYCSAMGGAILYLGSLAGHSVAETESLSLPWYVTHVLWRAVIAWGVGMGVFYLIH